MAVTPLSPDTWTGVRDRQPAPVFLSQTVPLPSWPAVFSPHAHTGQKVEIGNNPAIAGDGSGGWKVIYEGLGQNPHTLDSSGRTGIIAVLMDGDISPGIAGLFSR